MQSMAPIAARDASRRRRCGCAAGWCCGWRGGSCAAAIRAAARSRGCAAGRRSVEVRASIFCTVREPVPHPLCGFYAAAFTRLLALFDISARAEVVACRGTGEPTCVLKVALLAATGSDRERDAAGRGA